jgi:glutathione S-transferase
MITVRSIIGSPFGRAVLAGCIEKNAPYRLAPLAPGEHKAPAYVAQHPFGRVPLIDDDGFVLYETQAILRYLDATQPGPRLTPSDSKAEARMNQAIGILESYVFRHGSALTLVFNRLIAPRLGFPIDDAAAEAAIPTTRHCMEVLAGFLAKGPYLAGDQVSLADLHVGPHLDMLAETPEGAEILAGSPLVPWLERLRARPSFAKTTWDGLAAQAAAA